MSDLFLRILEMSVMGSIVILVTLLIRFLLRKNSKKYVMILWAVVALRLLVPVSIESSLSVFNFIPHKVTNIAVEQPEEKAIADVTTSKIEVSKPSEVKPAVDKVPVAVTKPEIDITPNNEVATVQKPEVVAPVVDVDNATKVEEATKTDVKPEVVAVDTAAKVNEAAKVDYRVVLGIIWSVGAVAIIGYCAVRFVLLKRQLKDATRVEKDVYESEKVPSPFVFGFIIPRIYIPDVLDRDERKYILMHERTHIKHGDWISKLLGMVVVAVHWFNPLVWLAYALFEQDVEMHCDEHTVANLENDLKQAYTMSIVSYAKKSNKKLYLVAPLSFSKPNFSKREVTNRVKNIINYKKGTKITAIVTTFLIVTISSACALNATSETKSADADTEEIVAETVAEETTETTKELWTMPEVTEELPDFIPLTSATDDDNFDENPIHSIQEWTAEKNAAYSLLMAKAAEVNAANPDKNYLYGFCDVYTVATSCKLIIYDVDTQEFIAYEYENGTVEDSSAAGVRDIYFFDNAVEPENQLMPYEVFSELPGVMTISSFYQFDASAYGTKLSDNNYAGEFYGFSADMNYAFAALGGPYEFNYTADELLALNVGDMVNVGGENIEVTSIDYDVDLWGGYRIALGDGDNGGYYVIVRFDQDDNPVDVTLLNMWGDPLVGESIFNKIPVADDVEIIVYDFQTEQATSLTKDTIVPYLLENDCGPDGDGFYQYEEGGCFNSFGTPLGRMNDLAVIENGEITSMTFYKW